MAKGRSTIAALGALAVLVAAGHLAGEVWADRRSGLEGRWQAFKLVVDGKPVKDKKDKIVAWTFESGGRFIAETVFPGKYPFKRQGKWRTAPGGRLRVTHDSRTREFLWRVYRLQGSGPERLKLIEHAANKLPRIYRLVRSGRAG